MKRNFKRVAFVVLIIVVGTFLGWRLILSYDISRALSRIRAADQPTNHEEIDAWQGSVPDHKNAALVMEEAFALIRTFQDSRTNEVYRFKIPRKVESIDSGQLRLLADYVELNSSAIEKTAEALRLPQCRYFIDHALGVSAPLPHLAKLKRIAQILEYQALVSGQNRDFKKASIAVETTVGLARTLDDEAIVISQSVRCSLLKIATGIFQRRVNCDKLSADELSALAGIFAIVGGKTNLMARALIGERAMLAPYFRMSIAEAQRISGAEEESDQTPAQPMLSGRRSLLMTVTGFMDRDLRFYLTVMETNIVVAGLPSPENLAFSENLDHASEVAKRKLFMFSAMNLPSLSRTVSKEVSAIASVRLAGAAVAVERFRNANGRLPGSLSEIPSGDFPLPAIDPFDEKPLRYRQLSVGYLIYSVDTDGHDDGGRERPERSKSTDKISYDLTFFVER